jgi:hypothetical protein
MAFFTHYLQSRGQSGQEKNFFFKKVWLFQIKVVPLHQQFPPRLLTMRTTAGLRHLKGYEI